MSTQHTADLVIGFSIGHDDLGMPFKTTVEAVTHTEERYDQKTGKLIGTVEVVDSDKHEAFVFEGVECSDVNELGEAMEQHLKCRVLTHGDFWNGDDLECSIQPVKTAGKSFFTFAEVRDLEAECERIGKAFAKYGIHLGSPKVFALSSVS